jgi:transcription initiation factor TFIIIB Brf1 subunit/transcription initiation factor TFIIB
MKTRKCPFKGGRIVYVSGNRWRCQTCGMIFHKDLLSDDVLWRLFTVKARVKMKAYKARTLSNMVLLRQSLGTIFTEALLEARREMSNPEENH